MRICLYGAASDRIDQIYKDRTYDLGAALGKRGHSMVYGGGSSGLMGAGSQGVLDNGGDVYGVIPDFMKEFETLREDCTKMIITESLPQRKTIMEDMADAFVIVPGGIGTFDEFFQILTLTHLKRRNKKIVLYNVDDYYIDIIELIQKGVSKGFIGQDVEKLFLISDDIDEILDYLEKTTEQ